MYNIAEDPIRDIEWCHIVKLYLYKFLCANAFWLNWLILLEAYLQIWFDF